MTFSLATHERGHVTRSPPPAWPALPISAAHANSRLFGPTHATLHSRLSHRHRADPWGPWCVWPPVHLAPTAGPARSPRAARLGLRCRAGPWRWSPIRPITARRSRPASGCVRGKRCRAAYPKVASKPPRRARSRPGGPAAFTAAISPATTGPVIAAVRRVITRRSENRGPRAHVTCPHATHLLTILAAQKAPQRTMQRAMRPRVSGAHVAVSVFFRPWAALCVVCASPVPPIGNTPFSRGVDFEIIIHKWHLFLSATLRISVSRRLRAVVCRLLLCVFFGQRHFGLHWGVSIY
ncbi:LAFE_0B05292g1_1 [Lachancea fermentati]|uniref:LAFE_0B05292g1_1 n=1 Tax=Lachancea fermentati TaxID=4955 RepID=A0A1G4M7U4_LACFM|nr:LAFE_0B05292g1_1 [Lachancea fermentati]